MTKLVTLRVVLAVDDDVELKELKPRLQALIASHPTETIGENGAGHRIHWPTADVLQGAEGRSGVPSARRGRRATTTTGQADLIP